MKKIIKTAILSVIFYSCADGITKTTKRDGEAKQRIIGKEYTVYEHHGYQIIEVDGIEYISSYSGGICPLKK